MAVRLVVTFTAEPGKGAELARAYRERCPQIMQEAGCEQFEVFQSVLDPDKFTLLERWTDQAALDAHAKLNLTRAPVPLRAGPGEREDYQYNRVR
jgi:quinol monooxygenase YgiN